MDEFPTLRPPGRAWLVTFTDLTALLLAFFVMLFAMSNIKVDKWSDMVSALSQSLTPSSTEEVPSATAPFNIGTVFRKRAVNLDYLTAVLEEALADHPLLRGAQLLRLEDRLIIALPGDLLFPEGRANLSDRAEDALFNLGGVLRNIGNQIGVNGHSDPSPPREEEYASNWELSLARAIVVANSLKRSGYTEDIIAYGYSDSRYSQLPDLPDEQRRELGRRVDIMVMPTAGEF